MTASTHIRRYAPGDAAAVCALIHDLQAHERRFEPRMTAPDVIRHWYLDHLLTRCAEHDGVILVAESEGRLAGFAAVLAKVPSTDIDEDDYDYAYVSDIAVRADKRGEGLGSTLLSAAEAYARDHAAQWLRIDVLAANAVALDLYRRRGFRDRAIQLEKALTEKG